MFNGGFHDHVMLHHIICILTNKWPSTSGRKQRWNLTFFVSVVSTVALLVWVWFSNITCISNSTFGRAPPETKTCNTGENVHHIPSKTTILWHAMWTPSPWGYNDNNNKLLFYDHFPLFQGDGWMMAFFYMDLSTASVLWTLKHSISFSSFNLRLFWTSSQLYSFYHELSFQLRLLTFVASDHTNQVSTPISSSPVFIFNISLIFELGILSFFVLESKYLCISFVNV